MSRRPARARGLEVARFVERESPEVDIMRAIVRALLISALVILIGFVAFAYFGGGASWRYPHAPEGGAIGTTGTTDVQKARERGAQVGEKVAVAAAKVRETVDEAALTSKIKAKMVLDDS